MRKGLTLFLSAAILGSLVCGCGSSQEQAVTVQSVAMLCGLTDELQRQTFAGIVSTGNEANIKKDSSKKVATVYVKKGDIVKQGDKLFTYDAEQAQNSLDKAKLELEEQKNTLTSKEEEKESYEKDKKKAKESELLEYNLKIAEADTDIREAKYNISLKEKEITKLEEATKNLDVTAPISGMVQKAGQADASLTDYGSGEEEDVDEDDFSAGLDEDGASDVFIKLVEVDNYRIKGSIDESNIDVITTGMQMKIHSRVDDSKEWYGVVSSVEYKTPGKSQNNNNYFGSDEGDDSEMTTSSKYPFYVKIDALEGLMIGQHVYMTEYNEEEENQEILLSSAFINDIDTAPWIWAEKDGVLAKRSVTLGGYIEDQDLYIISDGLSAEDYIAVSADDLKEGLPVTEIDEEVFEVSNETNGADQTGEAGTGDEEWTGDGEENIGADEEWTDEGDEEWTDEDDEEWTDEDDEEWTDEDDEDDEEWTDEDDEVDDIDEIEERYRAAGEEIVG